MRYYLINRNFVAMWFSNLASILGGRFSELVIPLLVLGLTNSPLATGLVALSQQLGSILFAVPVGTWIEKKDKVKVIAISKTFSAALLFLLAFLIFVNQANSTLIAFLLFFGGILGLISRTSFTTMIPKVAGRDKLVNAHASLEGADAISTLIGPLIGGIMLAKAGADITILVCGLLTLMSMLILLKVKTNEELIVEIHDDKAVMKGMKGFLIQSKEGFTYLFNNPQQIISTLVICMLSFSTVFIVLTVIIHANTTLELSAVSTGLILSFAGIGNIIGVLIMRYLEDVSWVPLLSILLIFSASGVLLICLTSSLMMACIGMMIFDGALSMAFIVQAAVHQGITPDNALSRVRSSTYVIGGLFAMLGSFLSGAIPQFYSTNMSLVVGFVILAVPSIFILRYKKESVGMKKMVPIQLK